MNNKIIALFLISSSSFSVISPITPSSTNPAATNPAATTNPVVTNPAATATPSPDLQQRITALQDASNNLSAIISQYTNAQPNGAQEDALKQSALGAVQQLKAAGKNLHAFKPSNDTDKALKANALDNLKKMKEQLQGLAAQYPNK